MGVPADVVRAWVPDVDIEETDKDWILEAELPGARAEDVHVEAQDNELTKSEQTRPRQIEIREEEPEGPASGAP